MLKALAKALLGLVAALVGATGFLIAYFAFYLHALGPDDALLVNYGERIYPVLPLQLVLAGGSMALLALAFMIWLFSEKEQPVRKA